MSPSKLLELVVTLFFIATVAVCWHINANRMAPEARQILQGCD